jgi:hypothetical protein
VRFPTDTPTADENPMAAFWTSLSNAINMKTGLGALGSMGLVSDTNGNLVMQGQAPSGGTAGGIKDLAEAFKLMGYDVGEMAKRSEQLQERLQEAESERAKAEIQAEMNELRREFQDVVGRTTQEDPMQQWVLSIAKDAITGRLNGGKAQEDPFADAWKQVLARKMQAEFEQSEHPPTMVDQATHTLEQFAALKQLAKLFTPEPAPSPAGLGPKEILELEIKRAEIDKEMRQYEVDVKYRAELEKAQATSAMVTAITTGLESVGKGLITAMSGGGLGGAPGRSPARAQFEPQNTTRLDCPDCQAVGTVLITQAMQQAKAAGQEVTVTCTACGEIHNLLSGDEAGASETAATAPLPPSPTDPFGHRPSMLAGVPGPNPRLPRPSQANNNAATFSVD